MLKMVPMIFQGIGTHHRRIQYDLGNSVSGLNAEARYTHRDLAKRIDCALEFMRH